MKDEQNTGEWRDVSGDELRDGDWVRGPGMPRATVEATGIHGLRIAGVWWPLTYHWQRWTPAAPPVPDCVGHVGETFVGHVRPGQRLGHSAGLEPVLLNADGRIDRDWTEDDHRANPTQAVCPSCAKLATESAATIPPASAPVRPLSNFELAIAGPPYARAATSPSPPAHVDLLAVLRQKAKIFMRRYGVDSRAVLGALDDYEIDLRSGKNQRVWTVESFRTLVDHHLAQTARREASDAAKRKIEAETIRMLSRCAHGHSGAPGACDACAATLRRSDAWSPT